MALLNNVTVDMYHARMLTELAICVQGSTQFGIKIAKFRSMGTGHKKAFVQIGAVCKRTNMYRVFIVNLIFWIVSG